MPVFFQAIIFFFLNANMILPGCGSIATASPDLSQVQFVFLELHFGCALEPITVLKTF